MTSSDPDRPAGQPLENAETSPAMRSGDSEAGRAAERGRTAPRASMFSLAQIRHLMRVEFARAERYGYELSVLAIGVDHRAELRRRGGDDLAAEAVDTMVELLLGATRTCDHLGRLLDDRFLAVLPHTGTEGARILAERWRQEAASKPLGGGVDRLGISVGIAALQPGQALFFDLLVEEAVEALHRAQAAGGGRTHVHGEAGSSEPGPLNSGPNPTDRTRTRGESQ